jgi:hypothetical protein
MKCLMDNDVILKLAQCDLLQEALAGIGITHEELGVLQSARYKLGKKKVSGEQVSRILDFINSVTEINEPVSEEHLALFAYTPEIDPGEAILFSVAAGSDVIILTTGDKRSLCALAKLDGAESLIDQLAGRVLCLEQIIQRIIGQIGFEAALKKILGGCEHDTALRAIFGMGEECREENVGRAISSYVNDLRGKTGPLLSIK